MRAKVGMLRGRARRVIMAAARAVQPPVTWELVDPRVESERFAGSSVMVTGAAGLIGSALVEAYVAQGAFVHAVDIDATGLERLAQRLEDGSGPQSRSVRTHVVDLRDPDAIVEVVASIDQLNILVNNAAVNECAVPGVDLDHESWRQILDVNLVAPAMLADQLVPQLSACPDGAIVFITSIHGISPSPLSKYAASKAAAANVVVDLAYELAPLGVRVNAVAPHAVQSRENINGRRAPAPGALGGGLVPLEAIVHAVQFLSDTRVSPMTTGQQIVVDGTRARRGER